MAKKLAAKKRAVEKRAAVNKTTAKKKTVKKKTPKPPALKPGGVRVRMYCQGLGDCFLLTFRPGQTAKLFHLLIDCGLIIGTPDADARIQEVAASIVNETGGTIDLLVGTHEHWDHISGFIQATNVFANDLKIKQTWLAWTEDPDDKLAKKLRDEREAKKQKLALALDHFQKLAAANGTERSPMHLRLTGLAGFFGIDLAAAAAAQEGIDKTGQAMAFLRTKNAKYLTPGKKPPALAGLPGVEFFVLGPPTDEKLLKKDLPTKKGRETYEEHGQALVGLDVPDDSADRQIGQPFEDRYGMPLAAALADPYFAQMYDNQMDEHPAAWRRIDDVGLFAATDLALKLDADTNNTSLVLGIQLKDGRVLLFPGDAQVGNWESWHEQPLHDGRQAQELLASTVLYKVGHHGSHNATLAKLGLEMMTSPELTALLPVDEDVAHNKKGWTRMPFLPLLAELKKRCGGRILRADYDAAHPATDPEAGFQRTWHESAEKFSSPPQRSLYLWLDL
jgi:hypothetical protein